MSRFYSVGWFMILLTWLPLVSADYCLADWACWESVETEEGVEFWVQNKKPFVFTSTLDVKSRNLRGRDEKGNRFNATRVIRGNTRERVLTLYRVDPEKAVDYQDIFYWVPGDMDARHDHGVEYRLPFATGKHYPLVQGFGGRWSHRGASKYAVDFAMPVGTPVHAARGGTVVQVVEHHDRGGASRRYAEFANYIVVLHEDGTTGEYHHLMQEGAEVEVGQKVAAGDHIGHSGNTGFSSLPHLHFAVYRPRPFGDFESLPFEFNGEAPTKPRWE